MLKPFLKKWAQRLKKLHSRTLILSIPAYYVIAPAECSSNLARFMTLVMDINVRILKNLEDFYKRSRD